jgi:transcriptional regulator with XRE-family HTH domain
MMNLVPEVTAIRSLLPAREVEICLRLRQARNDSRRRQADFARELGVSRARLASYEYAKAPVRYEFGKLVCYRLNVNQRWLATGQMPMQPYFDLSPHLEYQIKARDLFSSAFDRVLKGSVEERFAELKSLLGSHLVDSHSYEDAVLDNFHLVGDPPAKASVFYAERMVKLMLRWLPEQIVDRYTHELLKAGEAFKKKHWAEVERLVAARKLERQKATAGRGREAGGGEERKPLQGDSPKSNDSDVKTELEKLIARVRRAAGKPGAKAELARFLDVAPARVTEWLTTDAAKRKEPGGHNTLALLRWVEQQERKPT